MNSKKILLGCGLAFMFIIVMIPIFLLIKFSISDRDSIVTGGELLPLWPYHPTLASFKFILSDSSFYAAFWMSIKVSFLCICFAMIMGVPSAYILARFNIPGKVILLTGLISVRLFPDVSAIIPVVELLIKLGLDATAFGAGLAHSLLALPYVVYIAMSVFATVPEDLEKQALLLGATKFYAFYKVILPLAAPGLAAAAIYTFLLSWDEFIFSYFLLGYGKLSTLTVYLKYKMAIAPQQDYISALSIILSVPVVIFTLILQKYMEAGLTEGSVK